jgi:hypothetical protein
MVDTPGIFFTMNLTISLLFVEINKSSRLSCLGRKRPRRQFFSRYVKERFRGLDKQITINCENGGCAGNFFYNESNNIFVVCRDKLDLKVVFF